MENIIGCIILSVMSITCILISYRQFKEKGFLFNNAYVLESKQERDSMDKKTYYKQSAIVFLLLGVAFLIFAIYTIIKIKWLYFVGLAIIVGTIVYAVISSLMIEKRTK